MNFFKFVTLLNIGMSKTFFDSFVVAAVSVLHLDRFLKKKKERFPLAVIQVKLS